MRRPKPTGIPISSDKAQNINLEAERIILNYHLIPLEKTVPNDYNPNVMNDRQLAALSQSMDEFNDFDPITVRPHPDEPDKYLIVDGEHRWQTRKAKGFKYIVANVLDLTEGKARKLTAVTILDHGTPIKVQLAKLLADIEERGEDLEASLALSPAELDEYLALARHDWRDDLDPSNSEPDSNPSPTPEPTLPPAPSGDWVTFTITMTPEDHLAFLDCYKLLSESETLSDKTAVAYGQVLAALSAEYLGSAPPPEGK